jgi:hypothetical protein
MSPAAKTCSLQGMCLPVRRLRNPARSGTRVPVSLSSRFKGLLRAVSGVIKKEEMREVRAGPEGCRSSPPLPHLLLYYARYRSEKALAPRVQ